MNKNVLIGIVAFGGLILVVALLPDTKKSEEVINGTNTPAEQIAMALPADLPAFPLYPEAEVKSVQDTESDTARDVSVSLETTDSKQDIHAWYREALSTNGWSIKSDKNVGGYQIIQGENQNLYTSLQVAGGAEAGEMVISQHLKVRK